MFGTMAATGLWPQHTIPTSAVCFDQAGIETASTPGSLVMQRCETAVGRVPRNVGSKRQPANSVGQFLLLISYPSRAWRSDFKLRTSCKPAKPGHHHAELQHDCARPQSSKRPDQMFTTIDERHRPVSLDRYFVQVMLPSSSEIDGVDEMIIVEWHFLQPTRQHSPRQPREPAGQSFRFGLQPHDFDVRRRRQLTPKTRSCEARHHAGGACQERVSRASLGPPSSSVAATVHVRSMAHTVCL